VSRTKAWTPETTGDEIDRLRRRIAELEQKLDDSERKFRHLTSITSEAAAILHRGSAAFARA